MARSENSTQAYLDAVRHAYQTGADWRHQYVIDCGWDHDAVQATALHGASDHDAAALGQHADDLVQWCREEVADEESSL